MRSLFSDSTHRSPFPSIGALNLAPCYSLGCLLFTRHFERTYTPFYADMRNVDTATALATIAGRLYAINAVDGTQAWNLAFANHSAVHSSPALSSDNNTVYVGSENYNVYAVALPCNPGFTGRHCKTVDHCYHQPCLGNATCVNGAENMNGYSCQCRAGFGGKKCNAVDYCYNRTCSSHGNCYNSASTPLTLDTLYYAGGGGGGGGLPEFRRKDSRSAVISSNGSHTPVRTSAPGYICGCTLGYFGTDCETSYCTGETCSGYGVCVTSTTVFKKHQDAFKCKCQKGHYGATCAWAGMPAYGYPIGGVCLGVIVFYIVGALAARKGNRRRGNAAYIQVQEDPALEDVDIDSAIYEERIDEIPTLAPLAASTHGHVPSAAQALGAAPPPAGVDSAAPACTGAAALRPAAVSTFAASDVAVAPTCGLCKTPFKNTNFCRSCGASRQDALV